MDASAPYNGPPADPINAVALPFFALLGILVTYLPCRSFWSHGNVPAVSIVIATNIINSMSFLNAIIWHNDNQASWWSGYGLCDIEALLRYPITMALATSLCGLSKGLADCLDTNNATIHQTAAAKRRRFFFDIAFCWAIPVLQMALHYVVQSSRYQVFPVFGCNDNTDNSWPTIIIIMMWCPIFTLLNMYYAVLLLFRLRKHRRTITTALTTSGSGFAARKYLKLVIITLSLIVIYLPVQLIFFIRVVPNQLIPYSWSRVHNPVTWKPVLFFHTGDAPMLQYGGWANVATSFLLWFYFGFNDTAIDTYRSWLVKLGFGHIWPSLTLSRETRMSMRRSQGSSMTRISFGSRFDLVGKAMKYFDGDTNQASNATTMVDRNSKNPSRKGSQGTLAGLTQIATASTATSHDHLRRKASSSTNFSSYISDLPTFANYQPQPRAPTRNPFLSTFRTQLNVPFPLFGHQSTSYGTQTQLQDLESASNIWSGPIPANHINITSPSTSASIPAPINEVVEEEEDIDPLAPKMGTRAYREREKREMLRLMEEKKRAQIVADREDLGWSNGKEGVKVVKSFDLSEENGGGTSSS